MTKKKFKIKISAHNMRFLKKLTCREITTELQQAYQEIQNNPHLYMNTSFELIADHVFPFGEHAEYFSLQDENANSDDDDIIYSDEEDEEED